MYGWDRADVEEHRQSRGDIYDSCCAYFDFMLTSIGAELARRHSFRTKYGINRGLTTTTMGRARFDKVKSAIPISTLLWEFGAGEPSKAGNRQIMSCPLGTHHDSTPSFTIYPGDAGWYCFGCNQGGTVIDLAMLLLRTNDPREALDHLETMIGENYGRAANAAAAMARVAHV